MYKAVVIIAIARTAALIPEEGAIIGGQPNEVATIRAWCDEFSVNVGRGNK